IFTLDVASPPLTVTFEAEVDQWHGSRSPGVAASTQTTYWPGAKSAARKAPLASVVTITTSGPVVTGGGAVGTLTEGTWLMGTRAPATERPPEHSLHFPRRQRRHRND